MGNKSLALILSKFVLKYINIIVLCARCYTDTGYCSPDKQTVSSKALCFTSLLV